MNDLLTPADFAEYAERHGNEAAYGLVLLAGPDGISGGWNTYCELSEKYGKENN